MAGILGGALLGTASGMRSMAAPSQLSAHLSNAQRRPSAGSLVTMLARPPVRTLLQVAAVGEMVVDKLPIVPARIEPGPLFGRAVAGAMTGSVAGAVVGRKGAGAVVGAASAVASAFLTYHLRRVLTRRVGLPDLPVAICEDLLAVLLARRAFPL